MPTTRSKSRHSGVPVTGQPIGINRLPPEVLSQVFVLCNGSWSHLDGHWTPFVCQTVIPAVCGYWRKVAFDTAALWTKVTLLDPSPWHFSKLCLTRAGPTALLDIDIDMREDFWDATENGTLDELAERAEEAFSFIVKHGGVPSRWRSFWMITDVFLAQLAAMNFFAKSELPSLVSLEMRFEGPYEHDEEDASTMEDEMESQPKLLFKKSPPQLRTVKFQGVPISYLFGHRAHPQLVELTHLELRFEGSCPHLVQLNKLLVANPNLETLKFDLEPVIEAVEVDRKKFLKVHLPKLQSLSFVSVPSSRWTLQVITMLDAPNITSFGLMLGILTYEYHHEQVGIRKLIDHITGDTSQSSPSPRFPSLRSLTLASEMDFGLDIGTVLAAYPQLTELTLPICGSLGALLKRPWLVPDLERLRVGVTNLVQLKKVVNARGRAGLPLRTVRVDYMGLTAKVKPSDQAQLRKYVDFAVVHEDGERLDDEYL